MTRTTSPNSTNPKKDALADTVDALKSRASDIGEEAKQAATSAAETARTAASETVAAKGAEAKAKVSERAASTARTLLNAAEQMEEGSPQAEATLRAAQTAENVAVAIRDKDLSTLTDDVAALARKHPGAFLAIAALAGFAAGRFLKSSAPTSTTRPEV